MKKILYSIMALAISAFTLQSCEDVPAPYDIPGQDDNTDVPSDVELKGDGTEANPYNIAAAIAATENLAPGETTPNNLYIKGVVTSVKECSAQFGNATFYLGDDISSTKTFYVYRAKGLNNQKIKADDEVMEGDTIIVCGPVTNYSGTIETVQNGAYIYYHSRLGGSNSGDQTGEAKGNGTLENPYNSVAANNLAASLESGAESDNVYIKGKISSIKEEFSSSFGNATFYISDDGTTNGEFYVYRTLYLGNKKYTSGTNVKVGDEVIIYGKVTNYMGNTPETVQNGSYLYSLNGTTGDNSGNDTPADGAKGDGTLENPYNSVAANKAASALAENAKSDVVYIKGKIATIREQYGTQFGNATFTISDDGSTNGEFLVFRALYLNNVKYTEGEEIHVGDDVVVCGKLTNYMGNTPETVQNEAYLYSLTCNGGTDTPDTPGGDTPDEGSLLSNGTFEAWSGGLPVNWKTATTAGNASLKQSTDAHSGQYSVSVGYVASSNKRLGYKETELEAGKYVFSFWAKATKGGKSQTRPGYVPVTDGKVGTYVYGDYADLTTGWTQVSYSFELKEKTTICLVIMNPKGSSYSESQDILIDDATLVKQ